MALQRFPLLVVRAPASKVKATVLLAPAIVTMILIALGLSSVGKEAQTHLMSLDANQLLMLPEITASILI
jgi:hypothetical protein